jgi:hypothetical protein
MCVSQVFLEMLPVQRTLLYPGLTDPQCSHDRSEGTQGYYNSGKVRENSGTKGNFYLSDSGSWKKYKITIIVGD